MKNILVTLENIQNVTRHLSSQEIIAIDTETTGLRPYSGDRAFALIISTSDSSFYFNLHNCERPMLPLAMTADLLRPIFAEGTAFLHNAKFDMAMLKETLGLEIGRKILDIWTLDRLYDNESMSYTLEDIALRHGHKKSTAVEDYIKANGLHDEKKNPLYSKVPFSIMFDYACNDGRITYDLGITLLHKLGKFFSEPSWPMVDHVSAQESELTPVTFKMEETGVQLDVKFVSDAIVYYTDLITEQERQFEAVAGMPYVKGANTFKEVFKDEKWAYSDKNNPKFDAKAMKGFSHPAAKVVVAVSEAKKQLDYFTNFYKLMDESGTIHTNFCQAGTATGRFSSRNPNLQNLTKPDKYAKDTVMPFAVRKAFVPRDGFFFALLDYEQIEYRVMLDMAKASGLIARVNAGLDVHEATAQVAGITRQQAKTVNFLTLYGGGIKKLAADLNCSENEARVIQNSIFNAAPEIKTFIRAVIGTAERRGYLFNQWGRRYHFKDSRFAYKAPNYLVQGTCAEILKKAMLDAHKYLQKFESRMILTIHDELIFEIKYGEEFIVEELAKIMANAYKHRHLPLLIDIEWSEKNLAEKKPWAVYEKTRDEIQRKNNEAVKSNAGKLGREDTAGIN